MAKAIIPIADADIPMVENVSTFIEDQKLLRSVLSFVSVLFMLKIDICLISSILLAKFYNLSSMILDRLKDCIKLKLSIVE